MAGGIQHANKLYWDHSSRMAFLIADNLCHGREFNDFGGGDNCPDGTPGIDIISKLHSLIENHSSEGTINVHFGRITCHTDKIINAFSSHGINLEVVDIQYTKKTASNVTTGVQRSIFKTMTGTLGEKRTFAFGPSGDIYALMKTAADKATKKSLKYFE